MGRSSRQQVTALFYISAKGIGNGQTADFGIEWQTNFTPKKGNDH